LRFEPETRENCKGETDMMSFCGLNCAGCQCYKATVTSDVPALEQVAKEWSDKDHLWKAQDMACLGCSQPDGRLVFAFCKECPVRVCALEKKAPVCAACAEYDDCAKFKDLLTFLAKPELEKKMGLIRAKVLAS